MSNALQLFRAGFDYIQIASHFNTTEAEVERQIHRLRQEEIDEAARKREERRAYDAERRKGKPRIDNIRRRDQLREIREAHRV